MKRRPLLFLWLAFTSLAWGATGLLTKSMFLPMGWNSDDFTHHTLEPSAFPNHEVTVQVHCPHLDDDATLHLCIYPFIEGESELGLPMQRMDEARWSVTFRYPSTHFVFNYNLGDRKHAAMVNNGTRRPNVGIDLVSDTLLLDTIQGWLDMAPTRPHLSGVRLDLLNHTRRHTAPLAAGLDTTLDNTAEAP